MVFKHALANSPARSLREEYIIRMLRGYSLDKFNASKVLPVSHGLLEEGFVRPGKIPIDLVRDHPVVPHAFLPGRRGSSFSAGEPVSRGAAFVRQILGLMFHVVEFDRAQLSIVQRYDLVGRVVEIASDQGYPPPTVSTFARSENKRIISRRILSITGNKISS